MRILYSVMLVMSLLVISLTAFAGPISDTFSDSVFGLKWTDDIETVKIKIPGRKVDDKYGILMYTVRDGREVLKMKRTDKDKITFVFDSTRKLNGVSIEFPYDGSESWGELLNKTTTYFGAHDTNTASGYGLNIVWPRDNNITLTLSLIPKMKVLGFDYDMLMNIGRVVSVEASKTELGF